MGTARSRHRLARPLAAHRRLQAVVVLAIQVVVQSAEFVGQLPRALDDTVHRAIDLRRHDDPVVVLGMLEVILRHYAVAGRQCISR